LCPIIFLFWRNRVRVARFEGRNGVAAGLGTDMGVTTEHLEADVPGELPNCFLRDRGVFGESGHKSVPGIRSEVGFLPFAVPF
jgi:hypothetical protein